MKKQPRIVATLTSYLAALALALVALPGLAQKPAGTLPDRPAGSLANRPARVPAEKKAVPEAPIASPKEILGVWHLHSKSQQLDGAKLEEEAKWEFTPGGKLLSETFNKIINEQTRIEDSYEIKDGKILAKIAGKYKRVRGNDKEMVLEGAFGFFYLTR
jgi:hypothetical protein